MINDRKLTVPHLWAQEGKIPTHISKDLAQYGNTYIIELSQIFYNFFLHQQTNQNVSSTYLSIQQENNQDLPTD